MKMVAGMRRKNAARVDELNDPSIIQRNVGILLHGLEVLRTLLYRNHSG